MGLVFGSYGVRGVDWGWHFDLNELVELEKEVAQGCKNIKGEMGWVRCVFVVRLIS